MRRRRATPAEREHVTESERIETALAAGEEHYRQVVESTGDLITIVDGDGRFAFVNHRATKLFGLAQDECVGRSAFDFVHPDDQHATQEWFRRAVDERRPSASIQNHQVRPDGTVSTVLWVSDFRYAADGRVTSVIGIGRDVTESERATGALRESEHLYRGLFDESPIPIWEEDFSAVREYFESLLSSGIEDVPAWLASHPAAGRECAALVRIVRVNRASLEFFGVGDREELQANLADYFTDESYPVFLDELIALAAGRTEFEAEIRIRDPRGPRLTVSVFLRVIQGHESSLDRVLVSFVDITEQKQAAARLIRQREQLAALAGQLLGVGERERRRIATELHDGVGQTLAAAKMSASSLAADPTAPTVAAEIGRLAALLDDAIADVRLLTSELSPSVLYELGLGPALEWLTERFLERFGLGSSLEIADGARELKTDVASMIFRAARELMNNVHRHSGTSFAGLAVGISGGDITLTVQDEGQGFEPVRLEMWTLTERRFGLLSIREEVAALGGTLEILSAPGDGTRIVVGLPVEI